MISASNKAAVLCGAGCLLALHADFCACGVIVWGHFIWLHPDDQRNGPLHKPNLAYMRISMLRTFVNIRTRRLYHHGGLKVAQRPKAHHTVLRAQHHDQHDARRTRNIYTNCTQSTSLKQCNRDPCFTDHQRDQLMPWTLKNVVNHELKLLNRSSHNA